MEQTENNAIEKKMTAAEVDRLAVLEAVIKTNFKGFYETGKALCEIDEKRLYRKDYDTFQDYVKNVWDIGVRRGYQLIEASHVVDVLSQNVNHGTQINESTTQEMSTMADISLKKPVAILNERQARELAKLKDPNEQVEAWKMAVDQSKDGKITARLLRACVRQFVSSDFTKQERKKREYTAQKERISEAFEAAYLAFVDEINEAIKSDYKETSHKAVVEHIASLYQMIPVIK